ncbi:MAG: hypothetical protein V4667_14035 [Bacteroidota bacterium]
MKKYIGICILNFVCYYSNCQSIDNKVDGLTFQNYLLDIRDKSIERPFFENDANIVGSPFLNSEFEIGEVLTKNGLFKGVKLKYNILNDTFLTEVNGRLLYLEATDYVKKVSFNNNIFLVKNVPNSKKNNNFLMLLDSNKVSLYCKKNKIFKDAEPARAMESRPKPASFIDKPIQYFVQLGMNPLIQINNLKDLHDIFPMEKEIKQYVKENDLNFKKETDLIKIMQFCGQNK